MSAAGIAISPRIMVLRDPPPADRDAARRIAGRIEEPASLGEHWGYVVGSGAARSGLCAGTPLGGMPAIDTEVRMEIDSAPIPAAVPGAEREAA